MIPTNTRIKKSAFAVAYLCGYAIVSGFAGTGVLVRFASHVHRAFWCAAIELAVVGPIHAFALLTREARPPGLFWRIFYSLPHFLWIEVAWSRYREWVQLFVVQGSISPFPPGTPSPQAELSIYAALAQAASFCCVIQIADDISAFLRLQRRAVQPEAAAVLADMGPLLNDYSDDLMGPFRDRLRYAYLAGEDLLCRFLARVFPTMARYLGLMAIGAGVAHCVHAYHKNSVWVFCVKFAMTISVIAGMTGYFLKLEQEAIDEQEALDEADARRHAEALVLADVNPHQFGAEFTAYNEALRRVDRRLRRRLRKAHAAYDEGVARGEDDIGRLRLIRDAALQRARAKWEDEAPPQFWAPDPLVVAPRRPPPPPPPPLLLRRRRRPRPRAGSLPRDPHDTILWVFVSQWLGRCAWLLVELAQLVMPPRIAGLVPFRWLPGWRWLVPEFAALWSEDARRDFYAATLAGGQTSAAVGALLVRRGALGRRDHEELWRRAGLTTDFVLRGGGGGAGAGAATASGISGGWRVSCLDLVWDRISAPLVCGLEAAFCGWVVAVVVAAFYLMWPDKPRPRA